MTVFTRTWNAAYEAQPADTEDLDQGAGRIRNLKVDIKERLEVDHSWVGDADDGEHTKVTFTDPLGADPSTVANKGYLYTKDVSATVELFFKDEAGNVIQLTGGGAAAAFPATTRMIFQQTAAPTGWTKDTTASLNDTALRVVTGSVVNRTDQSAFSTVFAKTTTNSHTLTISQIPSHTHTYQNYNFPGNNTTTFASGTTGAFGNKTTSSAGGGGGHSHNMDIRVNYHDVIIASKD